MKLCKKKSRNTICVQIFRQPCRLRNNMKDKDVGDKSQMEV
jgi:hypothetical protein